MTDTPATLLILLITVGISLFAFKNPRWLDWGLFRPYYLLRRNQYHTLITSGLLHGDGQHLLFNMLTFYFFGPPLERALGTTQFALLYVVALVLSEARTFLQQRNNPEYAALGASGAVSAILFAAIVYFPDQSLFIIPIPIPIPAPLFAVGYLAYSWYASRHRNDGINHTAHLDGALIGLLYVALVDPAAYRNLAYAVSG